VARDFTGDRGRILVVANDAAYRRLLFERLLEAGHVVIVERDGSRALQRLDDNPPELILCDLAMPEMDGLEVCRLVKQDPAKESIYFILLSSDERMKGHPDADDHLAKSCSEAELVARVRAGVRIHRLQRHLRHVSLTDAPTGLPNRRSFDQRLSEEVARCRRYYTPMSLVIVDLDDREQIEAAAAGLRERVRSSEVACRIGDSAFAVILANTSGEGARVLARDLEDRLDRLEISGSAGCAELGPGMDADGVLRATRQALEKRKDVRRKLSVNA